MFSMYVLLYKPGKGIYNDSQSLCTPIDLYEILPIFVVLFGDVRYNNTDTYTNSYANIGGLCSFRYERVYKFRSMATRGERHNS